MEKTKKQNQAYKEIIEVGFNVAILNSDSGYSSMYLLKNGVRQGVRIKFRSNNQSNESLMSKLNHVGEYTHLGVALKELLAVIKKNQNDYDGFLEDYFRGGLTWDKIEDMEDIMKLLELKRFENLRKSFEKTGKDIDKLTKKYGV